MRAGHDGFHAGHVHGDHALIFRPLVGGKTHGIGRAVGAAVLSGQIVGGEETALAARLDGHVGHAQTPFDIHVLQGGAAEFQSAVQGSVHAYLADETQNEILASNPAGHGSLDVHADGGGHLEPQPAEHHAAGDVRGAETGGERAYAAVGAGMAVRADDEIAGLDEALFGQERMFHARAAAFVIMGDAHFPGKAPRYDDLIGRSDILLRGVVIHDEKHTILVEDLFGSHGVEGLDGERAGDVVGEHAGKGTFHDLSGFPDLLVGVHLKYFLGKRHCHGSISRKT